MGKNKIVIETTDGNKWRVQRLTQTGICANGETAYINCGDVEYLEPLEAHIATIFWLDRNEFFPK